MRKNSVEGNLFLDRDLKEALRNYISLRLPEAEKIGLSDSLKKARTLTEARKIMQGVKVK